MRSDHVSDPLARRMHFARPTVTCGRYGLPATSTFACAGSRTSAAYLPLGRSGTTARIGTVAPIDPAFCLHVGGRRPIYVCNVAGRPS